MATYYRWDKYGKRKVMIETALGPVKITIGKDTAYSYSCGIDSDAGGEYLKILGAFNPPTIKNGQYMNYPKSAWTGFSAVSLASGAHIDEAYKYDSSSFRADMSGGVITVNNTLQKATTARERVGYVYSTSPTSFPNGGESGAYYYSGRTTVISPTAPPSLSYPAKILSSEVTVSWPAASSNTNYAVTAYELSYSTNGGSSWTVAGTTSGTSMSVEIPAGGTSIRFRVRAKDTNGQWSDYRTGTESQVLLPPTITVPSIVMQAQPITVNWTSITGASSYTLQRKADTDEDWTQVYSGDNLTFTESAGTWTSVQYRVQAVFDATPGGWATSETIPVIAYNSLAISGQDEDLGTITSDIPYSVATNTGNQISLTRTVNGVLVASLTVDSGFSYSIPVMDLPTGTGTIVITATVQTSSDPVTVTRTWTYTKQAQTFPGSGGLAQLAQDGQNMFPLTLAEAVKTIGGPWGGNLSTALDKLAKAAVFNRESATAGDFADLWGNIIPTVKIETGSYRGTGTYGADNPNTLTFSGVAQILFVFNPVSFPPLSAPPKSSSSFVPFNEGFIWVKGVSTARVGAGLYSGTLNFTDEGNNLSWNTTLDSNFQANSNGSTYKYVAVII